jgi:NhaP-type Na+/H+ or K+/H+ antiporter
VLEVFSIILVLIILSKFIEDKTKIPFVLIVIILSYISNYFFDLDILGNNFEEIIYLMLPIIIIPDLLGLSRSELKENAFDIFYLAFIAVIISIIIAVVITKIVDTKYHFTIFELLILFTPLMATDVVSVGAIFAKFKLPHKLKLYAEGESLFNDITAMVIFFFIAMPSLQGESLSAGSLIFTTFYTISMSLIIGVIIGFLGYYAFKISQNSFEEFISIYVMASISFLVADRFHLSGILAVVVSLIIFKYFFDKEGHYKKIDFNFLKYLNKESTSENSFRAYKKEAQFLGLFANAVIFISIANVINLELFYKYKVEILYVFILTTVVRFVVIFILKEYRKFSLTWVNILTLAGMKGGLALIMIVSLTDNFKYKEMFIAIILGVVILSIFVYTILLILYLYLKKDELVLDMAHDYQLYVKNIQDLLERDKDTGAYNKIIFEDLVNKEIQRAQRYKYEFSLVGFKTTKEIAKKLYEKYLRKSDYFGKKDDNIYIVLLPNTDIEQTLKFVEKLKTILGKDEHIAVVSYSIGDDIEMLKEKMEVALNSKKEIDVEV